MVKKLLVMPPPQTGIKSRVRDFLKPYELTAEKLGRQYTFIWPVSTAVCNVQYWELLGGIDGIISDFTCTNAFDLLAQAENNETVKYGGEEYYVYRGHPELLDECEHDNILMYLPDTLPCNAYPRPCTRIVEQFHSLNRWHELGKRLGIRFRAYEFGYELDDELNRFFSFHSPTTPVFVVADCEYVQTRLCDYFRKADMKPMVIVKPFEYDVINGRKYIDRSDPTNLRLFMLESACLAACDRVVNYGGFIGDYACKNIVTGR